MKTAAEKEFDKLLDEYYDKFDKSYPLDITSTLTTEEHISRIKKALNNNKAIPEEPNNPKYDY